MLRIKIVLFFSVISFSVFGQHSIQSSVFDVKNGLPLEMATVRLLNAKDSSLVNGCQSNSKGAFILEKVKPGSYILAVSTIGYVEQFRNVSVENKDVITKSFQLSENVKLLKEVEVKGTAAQMVVKKDTIEFNATAFKTSEGAVVEELIKKMPGVQIGSDGKITVNGQEIKNIRVDGKKFFSGDLEMATKNIPADMIEKIQVFEQKSDMAQLTGFEDNDTERILNLTTKPSRRSGVFGNVTAGAGSDLGNADNQARYDANAFLNIMGKNSQSTVTGGGNNVNTSRSMRGRFGGANSGINTSQNLGFNNNTSVNSKFKIGGDGSFNHSANESITDNSRESYLKGSVYSDSSYTISHNESYNANVRIEAEWKPDSMSTFVFQPNMSYSKTFSDSNRDFLYLTDNDSTSWGNNNSNGRGSSISAGLTVIYNRKFNKKGRSLTANLQTGFSQNEDDSYNYSIKTTNLSETIVDQFTKNYSNRLNYSMRVSFIEPLWNVKNLLETAVSFRGNSNSSEKNQFNKDNYGNFTLRDSTYSNIFNNDFYSQTLEFNYRHTEQNYNLMLGVKGEPSQTHSVRTYDNGDIRPYNTNVLNFAPNARFQYNFDKRNFMRLDYRGQTSQPSINQMLPVKNNSNLMNETVGNPDLLPSFSNNFTMFYSTNNEKTFSSFNTMLSLNATKDALVSNSIYDTTGKQYNQTVNANVTPYNLMGNIMFNTPLIAKRLHLNTATNGSYGMRYGYSSKNMAAGTIDVDNLPLGDLSSTRSWSVNERLALTFTSDYLELGVTGNVMYSKTSNNLSTNISETVNWTGTGNFVIRLPYQFNISSDINYSEMSGYANYNQNALIWNASIDKTLFKGKGVISAKCNDILHQQLNIRQTIGDNYIQYSKYNTLTSYFLVSFTYKIADFGGNSANNRGRNGNFNFGPGMMPPGGGDGNFRPTNIPAGAGGGGFNRF